MATTTTSTLSGELLAYLEKRFLQRSRAAIVYGEGAQKQTLPANSGKSITFNRYSPLTVATTALTEGTNPSTVQPSAAQVTATLAQYGNVAAVTDLLFVTSIDREAKEKTDLMAQNMAETLDQLIRDELFTGATVQLAAGRSQLTAVASTDLLTSTEVRKARRTLRKNNAMPFEDGSYLGKIGPDTSFDLVNDSVWLAVSEYGDSLRVQSSKTKLVNCSKFASWKLLATRSLRARLLQSSLTSSTASKLSVLSTSTAYLTA